MSFHYRLIIHYAMRVYVQYLVVPWTLRVRSMRVVDVVTQGGQNQLLTKLINALMSRLNGVGIVVMS